MVSTCNFVRLGQAFPVFRIPDVATGCPSSSSHSLRLCLTKTSRTCRLHPEKCPPIILSRQYALVSSLMKHAFTYPRKVRMSSLDVEIG